MKTLVISTIVVVVLCLTIKVHPAIMWPLVIIVGAIGSAVSFVVNRNSRQKFGSIIPFLTAIVFPFVVMTIAWTFPVIQYKEISVSSVPSKLKELFGASPIEVATEAIQNHTSAMESYRVVRQEFLAEYAKLQSLPKVHVRLGAPVFEFDMEVNINTFQKARLTDKKVFVLGQVLPQGGVNKGLIMAPAWAETQAPVYYPDNPVEPFWLVFFEATDQKANYKLSAVLLRCSDVTVLDLASLAQWAPSGNQVEIQGINILLSQKVVCQQGQWTENLTLRVPRSVSRPTSYSLEISSPSKSTWEYELAGQKYYVTNGQVGKYSSDLVDQLKFGVTLKAKLIDTDNKESVAEELNVELIARQG